MSVTTLYDTSPNGKKVKLDTHYVPPTTFWPENYPDNINTHNIARFEPQEIEQPIEIAFNEDMGNKLRVTRICLIYLL